MTKKNNQSNSTNLLERLAPQIKSITSMFEKANFKERRNQWIAVIIILAGLLAAQGYFTHEDRNTFTTDNGTWSIASNLAKGNGFSGCDTNYFPFCSSSNQVTAMREPIPVLIMAASILINPDEESGLIVQIIFYLGTALAIYLILKKEDTRLALLASFFWVASLPVISELVDDTGHLTGAFFFTIGMFFFLRGYREQKLMPLILSGIFLGIASLSRSVDLGISIGLGLVLLALQVKTRSIKRIVQPLIFLAVICLIVAPWVIRNKMVFGTPVIGSTLTGYNVYRMNFYLGNDPFQPHYIGAEESSQAFKQLVKNSDLTGTENETQMNAFYMKAGKSIILQYPLRYVVLSLYRFLILWFNLGFHKAYGMKFLLNDYLATIQQVFFLLAVTVGAIKKREECWPLILGLVLGCGAYMAIGAAQLRYLVDFMPSIAILSAFAILPSSSTKKTAS